MTGQVQIRSASLLDIDALNAISLLTGHQGTDATHLYNDPDMIGHIYSAPYLHFSLSLCFVLTDDLGVAGFVVGVADTVNFAQTLEQDWWPALREKYADPVHIPQENRTEDQGRAANIHHPSVTPRQITSTHPAHIHMNILPRCQGQGNGQDLLNVWTAAARSQGIKRVHLGANFNNKAGVAFWKKCGFDVFSDAPDKGRTVWMGRKV